MDKSVNRLPLPKKDSLEERSSFKQFLFLFKSKYGAVTHRVDVNLELRAPEIHALCEWAGNRRDTVVYCREKHLLVARVLLKCTLS